MRLIIKLLICLCLVQATTAAQEQIRKFMVGPLGDQIRIVYAVTDILPDGYKLQSMIIDTARIKNSNEEPSSVLEYLNSYAEVFTLRPHIQFRTKVLMCVPKNDPVAIETV